MPLPDMFIEAHRKLPEMPQGQILDTLLARQLYPRDDTLIRRSCYAEVGLYDESLPWEDWDMWLRLARQYSFVYSPTPSAKYRFTTTHYLIRTERASSKGHLTSASSSSVWGLWTKVRNKD